MARFAFLRASRRIHSSQSSLTTSNQIFEDFCVTGSLPAKHRTIRYILRFLIFKFSIIILILSAYCSVVLSGPKVSRLNSSRNLLICSFLSATLTITAFLYEYTAHKIPQLYNSYAVVAVYLFLVCFNLGTGAAFASQADTFRDREAFYGILGLLFSLVGLLFVYMMLLKSPFKTYKRNPESRTTPGDQEQNVPNPTLPPTNPQLLTADGYASSRSDKLVPSNPDKAHYNPTDPYHPLRMNPPDQPKVKTSHLEPSKSQEQESVSKEDEVVLGSSPSGLLAVRGSCILRWLSWSREDGSNKSTKS